MDPLRRCIFTQTAQIVPATRAPESGIHGRARRLSVLMAGGAARPTVLRRLSRTLPKMRDSHRASRTCRAGTPACCAPEGAGQEAVNHDNDVVSDWSDVPQQPDAPSALRTTSK